MSAGEAIRAGRADAATASPGWRCSSPLLDAAGKPVGATVALASLDARARRLPRDRDRAARRRAASPSSSPARSPSLFARRTLAPVRRLAAAAEAARQGNYDQKIATDRGDEVGRLAARLRRPARRPAREAGHGGLRHRAVAQPARAGAGRGAVVGAPQSREVLLLGVELRALRPRRDGAGPQATARAPGRRPASACDRGRRRPARPGRGGLRPPRARPLRRRGPRPARARGGGRDPRRTARTTGRPTSTPAVALCRRPGGHRPGRLRRARSAALVGLPVQQLESLLREATPGELLLSREVYEELRERLRAGRLPLAPRRGLVTPAAALRGERRDRGPAHRRARDRAWRPPRGRSPPAPTGAPTLSGIAPGALMGQRFEILVGARRRRHGRRLQGARPRARRPGGAEDAQARAAGATAASSSG